MNETPFLAYFEKLLLSKELDELDQFTDPTSWEEMAEQERNLLGQLFIQKAEAEVSKGTHQAPNFLLLAEQISPIDPSRLLKISHIWFECAKQREETTYFAIAIKKLNELLLIEPSNVKAMVLAGIANTHMAKATDDWSLSWKIHDHFKKASLILPKESKEYALLFWEWGRACFLMAKHSGEVLDFKEALEKFQNAEATSFSAAEFWHDYGNVVLEKACLLNSSEGVLHATRLFIQAVRANPGFSASWVNLALAFSKVYEEKGEEEILLRAVDCFKKAHEFHPKDETILFQWGQLLYIAGKTTESPTLLEEALKKYLAVLDIVPMHLPAQVGWIEVVMLLGHLAEDLSLLHDAKEVAEKLLEASPDDPRAACLVGKILFYLGLYFSDVEYYQEAITKLQKALSSHAGLSYLWEALAEVYRCLGELTGEIAEVEHASYCYSRAIKFNGSVAGLWYNWGGVLLSVGEMSYLPRHLEEAIEKFEKAIELQGGLSAQVPSSWLSSLGYALDLLGEIQSDDAMHKRAAQILYLALERDPECHSARYSLALALSHLGELIGDVDCFHLALEHFQQLASEEAENEYFWSDWGVSLLNLAFLTQEFLKQDVKEGLLAEAEAKFKRSIELGHTTALYYLASLYALIQEYPLAMHFMERAETFGGLPPLEELLQDEWLDGLRNTLEFKQFIFRLKNQSQIDQ